MTITGLSNAAQPPILITSAPNPSIPTTTYVGKTYHAVYTFNNRLPFTIKIAVSAPGLTQAFSLVNNCSGTSAMLSTNNSCNININFSPTNTGKQSFTVKLQYAGKTILITKSTNVASANSVFGVVLTPLPENTESDHSPYPVVINFTNPDSQAATNIVISKTYPPGFVETNDTCGTTLPAGDSCEITGTYQPSRPPPGQTETATVNINFSYDQSTDITATTTTTVTDVAINSSVTQELPPEIEVGRTNNPAIFIFDNTSTTLSANITSSTTNPTEFIVDNNTCTTTLLPSSTCTISGRLEPSQAGEISVVATLDYMADDSLQPPATAASTTMVINASPPTIVNGEANPDIPPATTVGQTYPVIYTFTNNGTTDATDVTLSKQFSPFFAEDVNSGSCNNLSGNILPGVASAPLNSCTIEGTFAPEVAGPDANRITFEYNEGSTIEIQSDTTVSEP